MIDFSLKYCIYETKFSNGFYYRGKGITKNVLNGKYTGSGVRYKLTCMHYDKVNAMALNPTNFVGITRVTNIIDTYATEQEAYDAEALFVPLDILFDPFCLNDTEGGRKGRYRTRNTILKQINSSKKKERNIKKRELLKNLRSQIRNSNEKNR